MSYPVPGDERKPGAEKTRRHQTPKAKIPRTADPVMRAIKRKCLECVGGSYPEVKECLAAASNSEVCKLHAFLTGGKRGRYWAGALKAIRNECMLCMGEDRGLIETCRSRACPLWPFRFGVRPATATKRGMDVEP